MKHFLLFNFVSALALCATFLLCSSFTLAQEYTPDANTVALYHFNETSGSTISDASGNGNDGIATGTTIVDGKFGNARDFNGSSDYIKVTCIPTNPNNAFTFELYCLVHSFTDVMHLINYGDFPSGYYGVSPALYIETNRSVVFYMYPLNGQYLGLASNTKLSTGVWYHVAGTYDGNTAKLFINGVLDAATTYNLGSQILANTYLGANKSNNERYLDGLIDEVRISNKAREPWEFNLQSRIVFMSNRDGNYEIYTMNPDGTGLQRLTYNDSDDGSPSWSPDGHKILFESNRDGNSEIYVMNSDGTNQTRLTDNAVVDGAPSWSPDGSKIVFGSNRDGQYEIYVMNIDGTNPVNITNNPDNHDGGAKWSPDGMKIVFSSWRSGTADIWVMNNDGSNTVQLTSGEWAGSPCWSPDGNKIAYAATGAIRLMNADGTNKTILLNVGCCVSPNPGSWSPDGTKIVLSTDRFDGNYEIYVMNSDGTNLIRITDNVADDQSPSWSPIINIDPMPSITVSSPNGGENWVVGTEKNITWNATGVDNVMIELSTDNGNTWLSPPIVSSTSASTGSFIYNVPNIISRNCKIKISDVLNVNTYDISDEKFNIIHTPVIIVPGIMSSALFNSADDNLSGNERVWIPSPILWPSTIDISSLYLNDNGVSINPNVKVAPIRGDGSLSINNELNFNVWVIFPIGIILTPIINPGPLGSYRKLVDKFQNGNYLLDDFDFDGTEGEDLYIYPYDWRHSIVTLGDDLANFVNFVLQRTSADNVDIVAHSMGGLLTKICVGIIDNTKIRTVTFLAVPHNGAPIIAYVAASGNRGSSIDMILDSKQVKQLARNMASTYELIPNSIYTNSEKWLQIQKKGEKDPKPVQTYEQTIEWFKTHQDQNHMLEFNTGHITNSEIVKTNLINLDFSGIKVYNLRCGELKTPSQVIYQEGKEYRTKAYGHFGDGTVPTKSSMSPNILNANITDVNVIRGSSKNYDLA